MVQINADLFWTRVQIQVNDCWYWTGPPDAHGYGRFSTGSRTTGDRRMTPAHRVAYALGWGLPLEDVPSELDHLCHTLDCPGGRTCPHRLCCNPNHLVGATRTENNARGHSPSAQAARRERCTRGHNEWGLRPNGQRVCLACRRMTNERFRRLHKD